MHVGLIDTSHVSIELDMVSVSLQFVNMENESFPKTTTTTKKHGK